MAAKVRREQGAWWVFTHHNGKRKKKRVGPTKTNKRLAEEIAEKINAALVLGTLSIVEADKPKVVPFDEFAEKWFRREVQLPM